MKVSNFSLKMRRTYEAPIAELIVIETQGVLCASGGAPVTSAGGGTESMNLTDVNWP
jgi:hypothetical protein